MRQVLPDVREVAADELIDLYPWPDGCWTRACLVMSLDGSLAGPDGLSRSLSSASDRAVLAATRAMADAYLVGARTVRAEDYSPVRARGELAGVRAAAGLAAAPTLVVVSSACRFDWGSARFPDSDVPPIILTTRRATPGDVDGARRAGCEVMVQASDRVDLAAGLATLHDRGLCRVTVEGGSDLLAQVVRAGLLDEADITLSPTLVGAADRARGDEPVLRRMRLAQLLEDDGFLFGRYVREAA